MKRGPLALVVILSVAVAHADEVRLGGALGERFDLTVRENILKLDVEKDFFTPFVERKEKGGFIGLGKLADALVRFALHTDDQAVRALKDKVVAFILSNQQEDGYTGCLRPESRLRELWDIHEMGFIIQALAADGELFGNRAALDGARRNADGLIASWASLPKGWEEDTVSSWLRTLGLNYGLVRLQAVTGDRRYGDFVRDVRGFATWNCPVVKGRDRLVKGHAYAYLGACLEQLQLYRLGKDERLLQASRRALDFMLHRNGLLIDGAGGICECWSDDQDGEGHVGETCMVAYLLMFCHELQQLGIGDAAEIGDLMERAVYNALFAAQSRDGRRLRYYTPLNGVRQFWQGDLYCCPNNFRRAVARLPEFVFQADEKGVTANLYTACQTSVKVDGTDVRIREETDYPKSGRIVFAFEPSAAKEFSFTVRLPRWCERPSVRVNGETVSEPCRPGRQLALTRLWRSGDTVELDLPMAVRAVRGRRRQAGRFAVMRGPVVYALDTRKISEYKDFSPADVPTLMTMDPSQLHEENGAVYAFISTNSGETGFPANLAEGKLPPYFRRVKLEPFADEDNTLTYFRPPNQDSPAIVDDELLSGGGQD